ncbi:DUF1016 N-terminal domain-containing protein [Candidatus Neptunochlamydia vexilliferae]|nr:DUF1016 N-terminal domain-containing protein [Candidatus Neptunochlamydia vexilliferae]
MPKKSFLSPKKGEASPPEYTKLINSLKAKIRSSQIKAALAVNSELIKLYWEIGKEIVEKQKQEGWGSKTLERAAKDLQKEFPGIEGFSRANIFRMKAFFAAYEKVAQTVRQLKSLPIFDIPWGHNILLIQKLKNNNERLWYASRRSI